MAEISFFFIEAKLMMGLPGFRQPFLNEQSGKVMERRNFLLHSLGTATFTLAVSHFASANKIKSDNLCSKKIIREAHRGYSQLYPENTILAFEQAIKTGTDRIELDLWMSSDRQMMVIHDETVERTTNGKGLVSSLSLKQLKQLDAGSWKSSEFKGLEIPTLEEVFKAVRGKCFVNIDLKDATAIEPMVQLSEKMDMIDQIVITGKIPECTAAIRKVSSAVTMFHELPDDLVLNQPKQAVKRIREHQLPGSLIFYKAANELFIRESKLHGLSVGVWGVLEENDMLHLIELGVDSVMTDNLVLLNKILIQNNN